MLDFLVLAAGSAWAFLVMPNEVLSGVQGFLGPLLLAPVYWFTARRRAVSSALGGAFWIAAVTLLSQSWLLAFHPAALFLTLLVQIPWYAAAFALSSWLWRRYPGPWFQALWWTAFEFLRVQGFLAYPYGSLASSVWAYPVLFQSADLAGTSAITFLLAWTAAWVISAATGGSGKRLRLDLALGLSLWGVNIGYGVVKIMTPQAGSLWRPALVQQSQDPWADSASSYESALVHLEALSRLAMAAHPDAVVWSETAFVPSIEFHNRYHDNPESLRLVRSLETFLSQQSVPFLVGNDHREKTDSGTIQDFNAVLAWDGGWKGRYEKNRLVPFTETFPFRDVMPAVYDWLKDQDTHFWEPGREHNLLMLNGVAVGTPICFEDAFPEGTRAFAQAGARALVNLTNDAWAPGTASRLQHLSVAVFRSVETRLPLVRAANDGATAAITSRGELAGLLPIGPSGVLQTAVVLGDGSKTLYTQAGDWFAIIGCLVLTAALFVPRRVVDKGHEL